MAPIGSGSTVRLTIHAWTPAIIAPSQRRESLLENWYSFILVSDLLAHRHGVCGYYNCQWERSPSPKPSPQGEGFFAAQKLPDAQCFRDAPCLRVAAARRVGGEKALSLGRGFG